MNYPGGPSDQLSVSRVEGRRWSTGRLLSANGPATGADLTITKRAPTLSHIRYFNCTSQTFDRRELPAGPSTSRITT
jgi:hypothetical protein